MIDIDRMTLSDGDVPLVLNGLTLKNYRSYNEFYICRQCGKVYWQGTHWQRRINPKFLHAPNEEVQEIFFSDIESNCSHEDEDDDEIIFYDAQTNV